MSTMPPIGTTPPPPDPPPDGVWTRLHRRLYAAALDAWLSLRALGRVLWLCRFSLGPLLIGAYALLLNDQAQEVLREFAARDGWWGDVLEFLVFALVFLLWALNTWLCARLLTELRLPESPPHLPHELFYRIWVPRALGAVAALVVPAGMLIAAQSYVGHSPTSLLQMRIIAVALLAIAAVFIVYIVFRSHMNLRMLGGGQNTRDLVQGRLTIPELHPFDRRVFLFTVAVTVVTFCYFWLGHPTPSPVVELRMLVFDVAPLGAAAILLLALAAWIPFGSLLVYWSALSYRVPYFALMLAGALLFSLWNDNHAVRTLEQDATGQATAKAMVASGQDCEIPPPPDAQPQPPGAQYPLCGYIRGWLRARAADIAPESAGQPYRVNIVAAAGGGIRAGYWTAGVLSFYQDNDATFAGHTLAISAVSGGSLGAVVFDGLLIKQREARAKGSDLPACAGTFEKQPLTCRATSILGGDFLAPTLGVMLYPDLVQRFLPVAFPLTDRARALETSWESRWQEVMHDDWMNASFDALANPDPDAASGLPLLLLNVTDVEDGKRALVSPLAVAPLEFPDTTDVRKLIGKPLRMSTAAHLSARFMYVSPVATVRVTDADGTERTWGHLADGGYFENSGAATAQDVLAALQRATAQEGLGKRVQPVVMLLSNNPDMAQPTEDPSATPPDSLRFAVETRAPLQTLLQTREGRGTQAQAVLKRAVEWRDTNTQRGIFKLYQPRKDIVPLPLGWMLSPSARRALDTQILQQSLVPGGTLR
ncbi:MAG TPA: hypothetical protein VGH59_07035 [Casimicrobiaceae bacterium]